MTEHQPSNSRGGLRVLNALCSAPEPNWAFNADANTGHGFAILSASVGTLRASRSGAG